MRAAWHKDPRQQRGCAPVVDDGDVIQSATGAVARGMWWNSIPEFSNRGDLGAEPLERCARLYVTGYGVEWIRLYREMQAGVIPAPADRSPVWRRMMEALRVEDGLQSAADRAERERS